MSNTPSIPSESEFINEWLPTLEQHAVIKKENAIRWREDVLAAEPDRFEWHFERLKGWGGSDIGEIAASYLGEANMFSTVRDLGEHKLMIRSPGGQTPYMRRGTLLEDTLSIIFREDFGAKRIQSAIDAINNGTDPNHKWLRGNTDDVVIMPDGTLLIVDYKCASMPKSKAPIQYQAQTHQYHHLLKNDKDFQAISRFGDIELAIVYMDYDAGLSLPVHVDYSDEIMDAVLTGGDTVWQYVVEGNLQALSDFKAPDEEAAPYEYSDEELEKITELEDEWSTALMLSKAAIKREEELKRQVLAEVAKKGRLHGFKDTTLSMATLSVRQSVDFNILNELEERGAIDPDDYMVDSGKYDTDAMASYLLSKNIDLEQFKLKKPDIKKLNKVVSEKGLNLDNVTSESLSISIRASKAKNISKDDLEFAENKAYEKILNAEKQLHLEDIEANQEEEEFIDYPTM
jgi:hypothetical protein